MYCWVYSSDLMVVLSQEMPQSRNGMIRLAVDVNVNPFQVPMRTINSLAQQVTTVTSLIPVRKMIAMKAGVEDFYRYHLRALCERKGRIIYQSCRTIVHWPYYKTQYCITIKLYYHSRMVLIVYMKMCLCLLWGTSSMRHSFKLWSQVLVGVVCVIW